MTAETPLPAPPMASSGFSSAAAQRAARNATALAISNIVSKGVLFAWQLVLARWLGAEGYGIYGTIGALMAVGAAIPDFGMGLIVIRDVASRPQDANRYLTATLALQPILAALGYAVLTAAAFLFGYDAELRALLAFAALNLLVDALGNMCHNQLLAIERMVIPAAIATGHVIVLVILAAIALGAGAGLWGLYAATLTAGLLRAAVYWAALLRVGARPQFPVDWGLARGLLVAGWPIAVTSFLALAYQHADKLLTTALIGAEGTGQLTAGFVIVFGVIELLSTTVLVAVFPLMSRTYAGGQQRLFEVMLEKLAFLNLTVSLPVAIFTSLLAVPLAAWVFGAEFTRTADVLRILIWYTVVAMISAVFAKALLVQNRQRRLMAIRVSGLLLNIVLLLVLLPALEVPGAAVATLIAEALILVAVVRSFHFPADWWARMVNHLWRLALVGAATAIIVLALRGVHPLLAALVGAPAYGVLLLLSGAFARDDWDLIYRLATAMPGGALIGRWWRRELPTP
jgi:O-antigen/teichoic acid export membrane protein